MKRRQEATTRPLSPREVSILLSLRRHGEPVYESADVFYSDAYREIHKLRNRPLTADEAKRLLQLTDKSGKPLYAEEALKLPDGTCRIPTEQQAKDLCGVESFEIYRPATQEEADRLYADIHSRLVTEDLPKRE
jgi:hypothetical protein